MYSIVTILNQILGLKNGRSFNEVILVFLVTMCSIKERQVHHFQVAKFLVESMHIDLVIFGTLKNFKYQSYLMHLFFYVNYEHFLEFQRHEQPTLDVEIYFYKSNNNEGMFKSINQVMS